MHARIYLEIHSLAHSLALTLTHLHGVGLVKQLHLGSNLRDDAVGETTGETVIETMGR